MCGIAGLTRDDPAALTAALSGMLHRGPDDQGQWADPRGRVRLGQTRLAIIDLTEGGHQPMVSPCGRWALTYNGEIYNYRDLRAGLQRQGVAFRTESDTEVLLALLTRDGPDAVAKLVGMFAFALWDAETATLLLGRDRFGIKPLAYAPLADGGLAFASEIRALAGMAGVDTALDPQALSEYLACLYVPAPLTIHRGIRKLPPGHLLTWRAGQGAEIRSYWRPSLGQGRMLSVEQAVEELAPVLESAVTDALVSDVPVGCFLSGGVDSSVIAAIMSRRAREMGGPPVRTFTMTFEAAAYDEREQAAAIARHIGSTHTELPADPGVASRLDAMVAAFGEPFGNPTALLIDDLSRKAREHVTVALVGDGGDEVFAGYPRYDGILLGARARRLLPGPARRLAGLASRLIPDSSSGRHGFRRAREFLSGLDQPLPEMYAGWVEYFDPARRRDLLGLDALPDRPVARLFAEAPADPLDAAQWVDQVSFLPGNLLAYGDAMSMMHSLELRLPLLDHRLAEAVGAIAARTRVERGKKTLLRALARRYLPSEIVDAPKRGFNPPMGMWLRRELKSLVADRLTRPRMEGLGLSWPAVKVVLDTHARGGRDNALEVWALLVLDAWADSAGVR